MDELDKGQKFQLLTEQIRQCRRCQGLNLEGVTQSSPGFGSLYSRVAIIGQSLCRTCMKVQIPFTGGSGRLLDMSFEAAGVQKSDVFITNVVHCHTPDNRKSLDHEISNCRSYLMRELEIVNPKVLIPLGQDAIKSVLEGNEYVSWSKFIGKRIAYRDYIIYPTYHPSYIMKLGKSAITDYVNCLANILRRELILEKKQQQQ